MLALASAVLLSGIRFDHNTLNLHDQDGAALTTFRQLLADNDLTPWTGITIADDAAQADSYRDQFARSDLVDKVVSIADFIPGDQDEKLYIIDEMSLLLGDLSVAAQPDAETQSPAARLAALHAFQEKLAGRRERTTRSWHNVAREPGRAAGGTGHAPVRDGDGFPLAREWRQ